MFSLVGAPAQEAGLGKEGRALPAVASVSFGGKLGRVFTLPDPICAGKTAVLHTAGTLMSPSVGGISVAAMCLTRHVQRVRRRTDCRRGPPRPYDRLPPDELVDHCVTLHGIDGVPRGAVRKEFFGPLGTHESLPGWPHHVPPQAFFGGAEG
jgi:ABC-type Na+ transport system ATPase subunit NatA